MAKSIIFPSAMVSGFDPIVELFSLGDCWGDCSAAASIMPSLKFCHFYDRLVCSMSCERFAFAQLQDFTPNGMSQLIELTVSCNGLLDE
ncbi:MAG TPA: hypothetical protein PKD31_06810, partial [Blastocatellia bacterium]|nr:hypothetical protein [Blastocatellia bacterium]